MIIIVKPWLWIVCRRWGWWWWWSQGGVGHKVRTHGEAFHHLNIQGCMFFVVRKYIIFHIFPRILHGLLLWYWTRQNYSLVEQPVDILINKLTKISMIFVNPAEKSSGALPTLKVSSMQCLSPTQSMRGTSWREHRKCRCREQEKCTSFARLHLVLLTHTCYIQKAVQADSLQNQDFLIKLIYL